VEAEVVQDKQEKEVRGKEIKRARKKWKKKDIKSFIS